jgi:sulfatase modifying factor 1
VTDPLTLARELAGHGDLPGAASAYDRAYARGFDVAAERRDLLDRLAVEEHGIRFRYVPAGTFLMGSADGEPDESPVHPVTLDAYWLAETPMTWAAYCDLMGWEPPPAGLSREEAQGRERFFLYEQNKIRLQYCESETLHASDWHAHVPGESMFGPAPRADAERPWRYDAKPMVSVGWQDAEDLCARLSTSDVHYTLPTEAEWEKAARGGQAGRRYPWGDDPPTPDRCDFDRFGEFAIRAPLAFPPNGYGLYAMSGTVWEWTSDWYDALSYSQGGGDGVERVLRGGSWSDCADAVTVSFRMSRGSRSWKDAEWGDHLAPNIGFRLCRRATTPSAAGSRVARGPVEILESRGRQGNHGYPRSGKCSANTTP